MARDGPRLEEHDARADSSIAVCSRLALLSAPRAALPLADVEDRGKHAAAVALEGRQAVGILEGIGQPSGGAHHLPDQDAFVPVARSWMKPSRRADVALAHLEGSGVSMDALQLAGAGVAGARPSCCTA